MTIDMNLKNPDDAFFEDIEEIMEDQMIQMFVPHPGTSDEIGRIQELAAQYQSLFYTLPLSFMDLSDAGCVGFRITPTDTFGEGNYGKTLFIDEADLATIPHAQLATLESGIILNATHTHETLPALHVSLGADAISAFDTEALSALPMDRIVLQSAYPDNDFDALHDTVKSISDAMFRPEQSIIARATKSSLTLLGFRP